MDHYYKILGIKPGASKEEIKQAYRDMLKVWHPDRFARESPRLQKKAEDNAKTINEAYEKLMSLSSGTHSDTGTDTGSSRERNRGRRRRGAGQADGRWEEFWKTQEDFKKQREIYREEFWRNREEQRRKREILWEKLAKSHLEADRDRDEWLSTQEGLGEAQEDLRGAQEDFEEVQEDLEGAQEDFEVEQEDRADAQEFPREGHEDFREEPETSEETGSLLDIKSRLATAAIIMTLMCGAALLGALIYEYLN